MDGADDSLLTHRTSTLLQLSLNRVELDGEGGMQVRGCASPVKGAAFGSLAAPGPAAPQQDHRQPGSSASLLEAAARLQGMGGRSVALGRRV